MKNIHEIWAIEKNNGALVLKQSCHKGLANTIEIAEKLLEIKGWYAIGVKLQGKSKWSYLN